jgi:hypothetical protein
MMKVVVIRETNQLREGAETFIMSQVYINGLKFCECVEDMDRQLEFYGASYKVKKQTAIPRGTYALGLSFSHRFQKVLPILSNVPFFEGVRIHGGNRAEDSEGCLIFGKLRTVDGVSGCANVMTVLMARIEAAEEAGEICLIEIK